VWLVAARGRELKRIRQDGRYANSPDTMQQAAIADHHAQNIPVLLMMRQNGAESDGWRDLPFWWPVIVSPIQRHHLRLFRRNRSQRPPNPIRRNLKIRTHQVRFAKASFYLCLSVFICGHSSVHNFSKNFIPLTINNLPAIF
jgi:hypothetical protein